MTNCIPKVLGQESVKPSNIAAKWTDGREAGDRGWVKFLERQASWSV